jgi:hypothetical protein
VESCSSQFHKNHCRYVVESGDRQTYRILKLSVHYHSEEGTPFRLDHKAVHRSVWTIKQYTVPSGP